MQLTIFTDYGLRVMMYVASHPDRLCNVKEIAEHYGISRNHLVKVTHRLAQLGHIHSIKGKGGGIRLARAPEKLAIGRLVRELEPNFYLVECFDKATNQCRITRNCRLKHYLAEAGNAFLATLDNYTLADAITQRLLVQLTSPPSSPK